MLSCTAADGVWTQRVYSDLDAAASLDSLGASLSLAQIYRGIDFAQA